jgi:hypothetical protein
MAMTKESMANKIEAAVNAVENVQTSDPAAALVHRRAIMVAFCQGIIEEIQQNAEVTTTSGAPDNEHSGEIA